MLKIITTLLTLALTSTIWGIEICGEDLTISRIGNYSTGSGGPYYGDLYILAGGQGFEWRKRYGLDDKLVDQTLSLAMFAKATNSKVDIYCSVANQRYNARFIIVK